MIDKEHPRNTVAYTVKSGTTVELGDLMFLDDINNLRNGGNSTADWTAYPLSWLRPTGTTLEAKKALVQCRFLGIALWDKDGDAYARETLIPIAKSGQFDLDLKPAKSVNVGDYVGPSGTTASSNLLDQYVGITTAVTKALGFVVEKALYARKCRVQIRTAFSVSEVIT